MGALIEGAGGIYTGIEEGNASETASRQQLARDRQQAIAGVQMAQEKGAYETGKGRITTSQLLAKQKVAYANSGVDSTRGTAAAVQADTAALSELDIQTQKNNEAREVWGFKRAKSQAWDAYQQRSANINNKETGAILGGMSSWVNGIAKLAMGGG